MFTAPQTGELNLLSEAASLRTTIQRSFYRNGRLREEMTLRGDRRHGRTRTWHKNGRLASEEYYENGLLHGVCRQWNESGKLLGRYTMTHGTGIQRTWHDNGRPAMEISTLAGEFCGRSRVWLRDGSLLSNQVYLRGKLVSDAKYRRAAIRDETLPRLRRSRARPPKLTEKHIHHVFVDAMLAKRNREEALAWFENSRIGERVLGRFKRQKPAMEFVTNLYQAGALEVLAADIYKNRAGDQFADSLLVRLPRASGKRRAIRQVCTRLEQQNLGAVQPDHDIGETHLFISLS